MTFNLKIRESYSQHYATPLVGYLPYIKGALVELYLLNICDKGEMLVLLRVWDKEKNLSSRQDWNPWLLR